MKKYIVSAVFITLGLIMWAVDVNDFLIGAYSQYHIKNAGYDFEANFDSLRCYLANSGYNAVNYSLHTGYQSRLSSVFNKLHNNGISSIRSILTDCTWNIANSRIGVGSLAYGNRLQIEAEYQLKDSLGIFIVDGLYTDQSHECLESYNYVTKHETGVRDGHPTLYSNENAWLCDDEWHLPGIALSHPRKRWKPDWNPSPPWPAVLSRDLVFYTNAISGNRLYLTVAMRFEGVPLGTPVADIRLKFYKPVNNAYSEYEILNQDYYHSVTLTPVNPVYGTSILAQSYPATMQDSYENYLFEYYVDFSGLAYLTQYMNGSSESATREFYHINPEIEWHGNGRLIIDYITIEDKYSRSPRTETTSPYLGYLDSQINFIENADINDNLLYFYGMDEPRSGQLSIYNTIQNHINHPANPRKLLTACWLKDIDLIKHDNIPYNFHKRFIHEANPDRAMVNIYPLVWDIVWNGINQNVQGKLDNMTRYYHDLVTEIQDSINPDTEIFYAPQTFGNVRHDGTWSYNMPPRSMVKALKFLPLCYAADGTLDFCLAEDPSLVIEGGNWVTPLSHDGVTGDRYNNLRVTENVSSYRYITEANRKIAVYGPLIRGLSWKNANKLMTYGYAPTDGLNGADMMNLNEVLLDEICVDALIDSTGYTGYVQCGYYADTSYNPFFMLVNRRAVFEKIGVDSSTPLKHVDLFFEDAHPQTVSINPSNPSHSVYGTHIALYDPYDDTLAIEDSGQINVSLDPGDGKLLQMCSSLPSLVTSNATLKKTAYLSGVIVIDQGAEVTMMPNTVTRILPNTCIVVTGGSTLNLNGVVDIAAGVSILVEPGSSINFNETMCTWGIDSYLQVYEAQMNVEYASFAFNPMSELPYGITLSNGSVATLAHVAISGSGGINVLDSDLYVSDIDLVVPANRTGIGISNAPGSHEVHIDNTDSEGSISGIGDGLGRGIYGAPAAGLKLSNVLFANLNMGVELEQSNAVTDSIRGCNFENCVTGISLTGRRCMPKISVCSFVKDSLEAEATGVVIYGAYPTISECTFEELEVGVFAEFTSSTSGRENFMTGNTFYKCLKGIESRGSSYRVNNNVFSLNRTGINMVTGSNMNLGNSALNSLQNTREHLAFMFDQDFYASVQLYNGHNNFHHDPGPEYTEDALDFAFNDHFQIPLDDERFMIDVSGNWFEDGTVLVDPPSYAQYITYSSLDPYPNLSNSYAVLNRMDNALMLEAQGQNQQAIDLYKAILDEGLISEEQYLAAALDGVYRLSGLINDPAWDETSYLDAKTIQYAGDIPGLSMLIDEYRVKSRIDAGDFQSAINIVEGRISSPRSEVDSLLAVLDLEMVLLLQNNDEAKQAVSTKYAQYKYPSMKAFKAKHEEHWAMLYSLAGKADVELALPKHPRIQTNYPNPFNPSTTIAYSLPAGGKIRLSVYNVKGQMIRELVNEERPQGHHIVVWDGTDKKAGQVCSGIYFVRLESGNKIHTHKMVMMK